MTLLFERIVVGTDGSPTAAVAVNRAIEVAGTNRSELHVVSSQRPIAVNVGAANQPFGMESQLVSTDIDAPGALADAASMAATAGIKVECHVRDGDPVAAILAVASEVLADLIVVGSVGIERRVFGSVPRGITQRASCDVLIVHTS